MIPIKYAIDKLERITIEKRRGNSWALIIYGYCVSKTGQLGSEPSPSNRTAEFLEEHRFSSPEEAKAVFDKYKDSIRINGRKVADYLE